MKPPAERGVDPWLVVLRADGVVDAVDGGASVSWLGRPLADAPGVPDEVQRAASELSSEAPTSHVRRRLVTSSVGGEVVDVELLVVEALPIRRALTSVHELVMRTLDLFVSQAKSNAIDLAFELERDVPRAVLIDGEKVAWAISTLIANALRYANEHVLVHVRTDAPDMSELVIEVSDDGPGMPPEQVRWLFSHNPVTGRSAGLALLLVRDVVVAHRGTVDVQSSVGRGSKFTMRIPRARAG